MATFELPTEKVVANILTAKVSVCVWRPLHTPTSVLSADVLTATVDTVLSASYFVLLPHKLLPVSLTSELSTVSMTQTW